MSRSEKVIIDTDPGVDDFWALCLAFACPEELEVTGSTLLSVPYRITSHRITLHCIPIAPHPIPSHLIPSHPIPFYSVLRNTVDLPPGARGHDSLGQHRQHGRDGTQRLRRRHPLRSSQ